MDEELALGLKEQERNLTQKFVSKKDLNKPKE